MANPMTTKSENLWDLLSEALGSSNVYCDPPEGLKMEYPAIVYHRSNFKTKFADNKIYYYDTCYTATLIDPDPDSECLLKMLALPMCKHDQHFTSDGLNHDVFSIKI